MASSISLLKNKRNIFLIYCTLFINTYVFFKEPFEFYVSYCIVLLFFPYLYKRHTINPFLIKIFLVLLCFGLFSILIDNNNFPLFIKVYLGALMLYIFYDLVIKEYNCNVKLLFKWYLKGSFIMAIIACIQYVSFLIGFNAGFNYLWLFNKWTLALGGTLGIRINGFFAEPTYLASSLSAAFFISIYNLLRKEKFIISKFESIVLIIAYILSFSGIAQLGILISIILLLINFGLIRYLIIMIPIFILLFNVLYANVFEFRDRYDSTLQLFSGQTFKLGKTHGSSFILYNNAIVTYEHLKTNFLFGGGLGSHPIAFNKYSIAKDWKVKGFNNNSADASSMLLRLLSETGVIGALLFIVFIFKCYVKYNPFYSSYHWLISNSILVMILLNLFRQGNYILLGFPFFVLLYYYNYIDFKNQNTLQASE